MSTLRTVIAVFVTTSVAVLLPRLVWATIDTYLLGHPDGKFGALGGIHFVAFFVGIAATVAGLVAAALAFGRRAMFFHRHLVNAVTGGLALSLASFWIPELAVYGVGSALFGEIGMLVVNWAVVCAVVLLLVQLIIGGLLPPNSTPHADARETAVQSQVPDGARAGGRGR